MLGRGNFVTNGDPDSYLTSRMLAGLFLIRMAFHTSEADYQSCSIEISDIYIYVGMYAYVKKFRPRF